MGNLSINNGGIRANKEGMPSIDLRYGPYESVSAAHAALSDYGLCAVGLTVGIINGTSITEYWYQGGTSESNLVKKQSDVTIDAYTKAESDNKYQPKGDYQPAGNYQPAGDYATKTELNSKVDKITGKGLSTNDYTNEEKQKVANALVPADIAGKANASDVYTKSETYTKAEVNGLVDTPHQEYITVDAYSNLPETGNKDTVYRVSNYNGSTSQVDTSVYSEYAWNGSQYILLCVKSQIGEVFDISVYNNNAKYADLAAAINGGTNIPQSLQKGGMSVKFVQSSDNKYVQFRYIGTEVTGNPNPFLDTANWQGVDDEPVSGSQNLVKSGGVEALTTPLKYKMSCVIAYGIEKGKAINSSYNIVDNSNCYITDYIPVSATDVVRWYNYLNTIDTSLQLLVYNSNKVKIDNFSAGSNEVRPCTMPANAAFVRATMSMSKISDTKLTINNTTTVFDGANYQFTLEEKISTLKYGINTTNNNVNNNSAEIKTLEDKYRDEIGVVITAGKVINSSFEIEDNSHCYITDYVPVDGGVTLKWEHNLDDILTTAKLLAYDSQKNRIEDYTAGNAWSRNCSLPANTAYVRASMSLDDIGDTSLKIGTTVIFKGNIKFENTISKRVDTLEDKVNWKPIALEAGLPTYDLRHYPEDVYSGISSYVGVKLGNKISKIKVNIEEGVLQYRILGYNNDTYDLSYEDKRVHQHTVADVFDSDTQYYSNVFEIDNKYLYYTIRFNKRPNAPAMTQEEILAACSVLVEEYVDNLPLGNDYDIRGVEVGEVPDYYYAGNYLANKINRINELVKDTASKGDAFFFITDPHWYWNTIKSPALIKQIKKNTMINKIFDGGDRYDGIGYEGTRMLLDAIGSGRYYPVVGNHDFMNYVDDDGVFAQAYQHLSDDSNVSWGEVGKEYYYVDNKIKKIRYVILQGFESVPTPSTPGGHDTLVSKISDTQMSWFNNVALNVESGWTVLIFIHALYFNPLLEGETYPYILKLIPTFQNYVALHDAIASYNGNGIIAAVIQGHCHIDSNTAITSVKGYDIPVILTTCDRYRADGGEFPASTRVEQTITEQAFDVMILDTVQRKITAVRVGAPANWNKGTADNPDMTSDETPARYLEEREFSYALT